MKYRNLSSFQVHIQSHAVVIVMYITSTDIIHSTDNVIIIVYNNITVYKEIKKKK